MAVTMDDWYCYGLRPENAESQEKELMVSDPWHWKHCKIIEKLLEAKVFQCLPMSSMRSKKSQEMPRNPKKCFKSICCLFMFVYLRCMLQFKGLAVFPDPC